MNTIMYDAAMNNVEMYIGDVASESGNNIAEEIYALAFDGAHNAMPRGEHAEKTEVAQKIVYEFMGE